MKKKNPVTSAGYLLKKPTGAIFASLQKYQVKQHANGMSESDKERVDGVRTEETDLTRRNRFPQQEMKRLPCSA